MDEADRMIDMGFEDDVRTIMSHFKVSSHDYLERNPQDDRSTRHAYKAWKGYAEHDSTNVKHFSFLLPCHARSKTLQPNRSSTLS